MFGAFLGFWHALWSAMVALGFSQAILDFIYRIHFLNNPFQVHAFTMTTALTLVIVTSLIGYGIGWMCAGIWNRIQKTKVS